MLNLIVKDFKLLFVSKNSLRKNIMSALTSALALAIFLAIEVYIFTMLLNKLQDYNKATLPFLTLFLFIISVVMVFLNIFRANKLFFNRQDIDQLIRRPISNFQIVFSKLVFLFIMHYFTTVLLVYPIIVAYGQIVGRTVMYYYQGLFYPIISFFFEAGIALILVYPFRTVVEFLKKHIVTQFVLSIIVMVFACFLYSEVLNVFMELVVNNNVDALFTQSSIEALIRLRGYLIPINFMTDIFFVMGSTRIFPCLCISLGIFLIGSSIVVFAYNYFRSSNFSDKKIKNRKTKIVDVRHALLKKELILLFKDSSNLFSFTGLLIVQPFLVYNIIKSLNLVFSSGAFSYYMLILPELIPLIDVLIVMLFTVIINQGANEYIQAEKKNVRIMKTIPVPAFEQIMIKAIVPFALSFISLLFTTFTLLIMGTISFLTFTFALLLSALLLIIFEIVSLMEELSIRNTHPRSTFLSSFYSYFLPFLYFATAIVACALGLDLIIAYFVGILLLGLISIPHAYKFKAKIEKEFLDLEMVN